MPYKSEQHEERKISYIWGMILVVLILFAGVYVYLLMEQQSKSFLSKSLEALLQNKVHLFANNINQGQGVESKQGITLQHPVIEALEQNKKNSISQSRQKFQQIANLFIKNNFLAVSIYDAKGRELAHAGEFSKDAKVRVPLNSKYSSLLWDNEFILNTSNDLYSHGQYIGKVITEISLPLLTLAFTDVTSIGKTGEFAICKALVDDINNMQCFLNGFAGKKFFKLQPRIVQGKPLPMSFALDGKTGLIFAQDYRKEDVVAAYSPVSTLGLGIVIKIDQNELYAPITNKLKFIIPGLIALTFLGIFLLRWLVTPLVRNLIISEQETQKTNIELQKNKKRYRVVLENSPYCIHEIDSRGRFTSMNPAGLKMLDIQSESDIKNTPYMDCVSDEDKIRVAQLMEAGLKGKQSDFEFQGTNGKIYHSSFVPVEDEETGILRLMGWTQDITERKASEEQLRLAQKMDALGKLTGGIAHDYNNMLAVILGYSEILEIKLEDQPKLNKFVSQISHAAKRGAKLTQKLLSFTRHKSSNEENLNINSLLLYDKDMLEKTLTARIKLVYELEDDLWNVWLDKSELEDVIINLSINAMHAINGNGQVTIQTSNKSFNKTDALDLQLMPGDYVLLSLTDTGCGMDEITKEKMFDPFYSTKGELGTGLGLSQVYGFVQRNNGNIKVNSELNQGTRLTLYFPRYHEIDSDNESAIDNIDVDLSGNEVIMVVDDEPSIRSLTTDILSQQGYRIICAENGKQALEILEKESIDLLLSDVIMPEMDGYQLAQAIQKKYPAIKIQLASGFTNDHQINLIDDNLHKSLLHKPYDSTTLLLRIRKLLDRA